MDSVLIVDDEAGLRTLMTQWVQALGYSAQVAASAEQALQEMETKPAAVALCDIRMPGRDGLWLTEQLRQRYPDTAVIISTAAQQVDYAVSSLRAGVVDYLLKPFDAPQLRDALQRGLEWHRSALETRNWRLQMEAELRGGDDRVFSEALASAEATSTGALEAMLAMLNAHDPAAYEHARHVGHHAVSIALVLGLREPALTDIERGALMHDIGKLAIPDGILLKPAALDDQETRLMRRHPEIGYRLLKNVPMLAAAAQIVLGSHEAFDGRGYPQGLVGDAIPIGARIVAVTDAYDSMTHLRVYRHALTAAAATREILRCRGTQFDPAVVDAMLTLLASHGGPRQL